MAQTAKYTDEDPEHWAKLDHAKLCRLVADLHKQRRGAHSVALKERVQAVRQAVSDIFIKGCGVEVGAGPRPFPIPHGATCLYGDIRDEKELTTYFSSDASPHGQFIDAQTFHGIPDNTYDFVVSAHVIEHLQDPIGSIANAIRVLKSAGVYLLVVPELTKTFDKHRKPTPLNHLLQDWKDGGASTKLDAYVEFIRDVAVPLWGNKTTGDQIQVEAQRLAAKNHDIHFHAWTQSSFNEMLQSVKDEIGFIVEAKTYVANENIFALRKKTSMKRGA